MQYLVLKKLIFFATNYKSINYIIKKNKKNFVIVEQTVLSYKIYCFLTFGTFFDMYILPFSYPCVVDSPQ